MRLRNAARINPPVAYKMSRQLLFVWCPDTPILRYGLSCDGAALKTVVMMLSGSKVTPRTNE